MSSLCDCRCTDEHAKCRPDLVRDVIPQLSTLNKQPQKIQISDEEPPAHLICPITQVQYLFYVRSSAQDFSMSYPKTTFRILKSSTIENAVVHLSFPVLHPESEALTQCLD